MKKLLCTALAALLIFFGGVIPATFSVQAAESTNVKSALAIPGHMNNTNKIGYDLTLEELTKPFASDLYYGRTLLSDEGKKAWDVALQTLLNYDNSNNQYPIGSDGNSKVVINYETLGIHPTEDDAKKIQSYLVRNDSRMYHLKDWGATYQKGTGNKVKTQTFYIGNGCASGNTYHQTLLQTEATVTNLLKNLSDDMTIYQQIRVLQQAYEKSMTYSFDGANSDIRGAFINHKAICGGYSKGWMYLMQRIGVNCIWVNGYAGGAHAWNYLQIDGRWYMMDTTWGGINWYLLGKDYESKLAKHEAYNTFAVMPTLTENSVPKNYANYPTLTLDVTSEKEIAAYTDLKASDLIKSCSSIYGENLKNSATFVGTLNTNQAGTYNVKVRISDQHGNSIEKPVKIIVKDKTIAGGELKGTYMIAVSGYSKYVLDSNTRTVNGVTLWDKNAGQNQKWNLIYNDEKQAYQIVNCSTGKVLTWDSSSGKRVYLANNERTQEQYWKIEKQTIGYVFRNSKDTTKILGYDGNYATSGSALRVGAMELQRSFFTLVK